MRRWGHSAFSALPKKQNVPNSQRGSVLLPVVVAIVLLAAVTFMLNYGSVSETTQTSGELERDRLRYVTEAGLAHAKSQLARKTSCSGYGELPETDFAGDSYSASISPSAGSPVTVLVTGKLQNGITQTASYTPILAYEAPITVMLQLSKDTGKDVMIDSFYDNANYGSVDDLTVRSQSSWKQRPLIEFDLSGIPADANIVSAILDLELRTVGTPGDVGVHRMTRSWVEGTGKGTGNADGATWNDYDGNAPWSQAGGDFDSTLYATAYVSSAKNGQRVTWDIRDLVDGWVSGQFPNYGLMLADDGVVNNAEFQSREEPDPAAAPRLTIVFACECGKACGAAPPAGKNILLVVGDTANLTGEQADKKALMEGWGHTVSLIATSASQAEFDLTADGVDVVYIPELGTTPMTELGDKADDLPKGVITEEARTPIKLGGFVLLPFVDTTSINIVDNAHYISETLPLGNVQLSTATQSFWKLGGTLAPDLHVLGDITGTDPGLAYVDIGETVNDGSPAAGRRVKLPWGSYNFDVNLLTNDGLEIMQRAIVWGAEGAALSGPTAHWKLDETSGTTAVDSVGGNDATLQNGPVWTTGQVDGGLDFDGADDTVSPGAPAALDDIFDGGGTLTAWMHPDGWGEGNYGRIVDKSSATYPGNGWAFELYGANSSFLFQTGFSTATGSWITPNGSVSLGAWQHVALVYDNSSDTNDPAIYIDGVEQAITELDTPSGTLRSDAGINFTIGNHAMSTVRTFNGQLDDVRVYDRMLSAAEVADLYTAGSGGGGGDSYLDEFNAIAYNGSDGTLDWTTSPWVESDDAGGGAAGGLIQVTGGRLRMQLDSPGSIYREADLSAATTATLTFDVDNQLTNADVILVEVSGNGGGNWDLLKEYNSGNQGITSESFDLTSYIAADTRVRIAGNGDGDTPIYFDDVKIALDGGGSGGGGGSCDGNFRDNFDTRAWNGTNGSLSWATDWIEVGESDGPTSGDTQVMNDQSNYQLRTRDNDNGGEGVEREADISGAATATLNYDYRRAGLDSSSDYTSVEVSANGAAGPWTELTRHAGPGNDSSFQPASHPITSYASANTRIRFKTSSSMGSTDTVWLDNIEITCTP